MMSRHAVAVLVLVAAFVGLAPAAGSRPVCTYEIPYTLGIDTPTTTHTCDVYFDAILVSAGNIVAGADLEACLQTGSGANIRCDDGCGSVLFTNFGTNVRRLSVRVLGEPDMASPDCTPTVGTILVQFGDLRDGGGF